MSPGYSLSLESAEPVWEPDSALFFDTFFLFSILTMDSFLFFSFFFPGLKVLLRYN